MAETSAIEWTDATWNPVTGCSVVSPGCTNCYAMRLAGGRLQHHPSRAGLTTAGKAGPVWNGRVRLNEKWIDQPLRWRRPRRIFVCAHGDLFHESVPDAWIDCVFAVMAAAPHHQFQVLTKRAGRMRDWLLRMSERPEPQSWLAAEAVARGLMPNRRTERGILDMIGSTAWPLPNVWLGVSAEDQARADERIPALLEAPAAVRFLSAEPLLGPVDLARFLRHGAADLQMHDPLAAGLLGEGVRSGHAFVRPALDWIIVGGESGPGSRPMRLEWARSLRDQCAAAGVACFVKQLGRSAVMDRHDAVQSVALGAGWDALAPGDPLGRVRFRDSHGGNMIEWPHDLRVREMPAVAP